MQDSFLRNIKNEDKLIKKVSYLISDAKASGDFVLFLEFCFYKKTTHSLKKLVKGYDKTFTIKKQKDDGSKSIIRVLKKRNISIDSLRVCGINTEWCVLATANGLLNHSKMHLEIIASGCNSYSNKGHKQGIAAFKNQSISSFPERLAVNEST
jgi:nicotinamidase-related amidase